MHDYHSRQIGRSVEIAAASIDNCAKVQSAQHPQKTPNFGHLLQRGVRLGGCRVSLGKLQRTLQATICLNTEHSLCGNNSNNNKSGNAGNPQLATVIEKDPRLH